MGKGIIECKGPYNEADILLPEGMTVVATNLHWKWDSDDYLLKVEHPYIQNHGFSTELPKVIIYYLTDEQGNRVIASWELNEHT